MTETLTTRSLQVLGSPAELWKRSVSLAALDLVLSPNWEYRYYSFDATWGPGQQMASMRNGSGDDYFAVFTAEGVFFKGFDHESTMSPYCQDPLELWPGMYAGCPESLIEFRDEPAFNATENVTFAFWWDAQNPGWQKGVETFADAPDPDGSEWLLELLQGGPERYLKFAEDYYEVGVALEEVQRIYDHAPLGESAIEGLVLGGDADPVATLEEIKGMGYGAPFPFA